MSVAVINQLDASLLSPLELQTLQEYQKMLMLLHNLLQKINGLKNLNGQQLLDNLRILETKLSLVFTLFKGSVYSLFLQTRMSMNNRDANELDDSMDDY